MAGFEIRWAFNAFTWKPNIHQLIAAVSVISKEEYSRIAQFRFCDDYKLGLIGRIMIRKCIHSVLKIPWREIVLSRSEKGKPVLHNTIAGGFYFNISHHGDYAVLAASSRYSVGIDIMKHVLPNNSDISSFFAIMKRQFSESEWSLINSFADDWSKLKSFYRFWCLKESYVKAIGTGIGTDSASHIYFIPETSSLETGCTNSNIYIDGCKTTDWMFQELMLDEKHVVSVAVNSREMEFEPFRFVTFEELLDGSEPLHAVDGRCWKLFSEKQNKNH